MKTTIVALLAMAAALGAAADGPVVLQNSQVLVEADPANGAFMRVLDKASGISLAPPQGLAENFRLTLFGPDNATYTIYGKDQKLSSARTAGDTLALAWDGPLKDTAGAEHKIAVRIDVAARGSSLEFGLHLVNRTSLKVREVAYPLIGGLSRFGPPGREADGVAWIPTSNPWQQPVKTGFGSPAFGYPGQMNMSFACIQSKSAGRSLYISSQDKIARYKTYRFLEIAGDSGKDVFVCIQHLPFTAPDATFDGSIFVLRFIDGDWRAAGQVYREWFESAFGIMEPSKCWIRRESFFLMTMFMLPEGTINYKFKDIPRWAKSAHDHGINAVMISGWQMGGHDNGYPYYVIDPRLGTWKELEDGIRACHKMGVRVYFFVNYQPMMTDSEWYSHELQFYREMTADGGLTWNAGWGMGTLWARMGRPKLMTWADLAFPQFRKIIVDQFARLAKIGADGVHVDKMFPTAVDYNPNIPASPDTATWEGAIRLTQQVFAACRKYSPDWAMSFECNWDRMLQFTGATWWVGNQLVTRSVFPENVETLGLYQACDYLGVNNAVRGGHAVMVAPLNFCRSLEWPPFAGLADYIKEVKRIRDSLRETVFYGEVLGREGATLQAGQARGIDYSVFRNLRTGRRVCIITNSSMEAQRPRLAGFTGAPAGTVRVLAPFKQSRLVALPAEIEVPAERICFVEEMGR